MKWTLHAGCIFEPPNDNQNTLAAVTTKRAEGLENWEEALVCGGVDDLFQKWPTELSVLTNYEARLNHFK